MSVRTRTQLHAQFADNTTGDIGADDLRDLVDSVDTSSEVDAKLSTKANASSVGVHTTQIAALRDDVDDLELEVAGLSDEHDALVVRQDAADAAVHDLGEGLDLQGNTIASLAGQLSTKASNADLNTLSNSTANALSGKANAVHTHAIGDVVDLSTQLAGKASASHTHTSGQITDLTSTLAPYATSSNVAAGLAGKANTTHAHAIADVTNLQSALNGKLGINVDNNSSVIATGSKGPTRVGRDCTIAGWYLDADASTTTNVSIYVNGALASASAPLTLLAATSNNSTTLTGWTVNLTKGDAVTFNVTANNNAKRLGITLLTVNR